MKINIQIPELLNSAAAKPKILQPDTYYRTLVEQIPAVVFLAQMEGGIGEAYISPQIETILGFTPEEWLGDPVLWYRQLHDDDKARWAAEGAQFLASGNPLKSTYRLLDRNGAPVWFRCQVAMVRHEDGRPWFIHGVAFDISEMKRAEESLEKARVELEMRVEERTAQLAYSNHQLERAMEEARSADRAKSEFLATMSHEIRTPMNGVLGMVQILLETSLSENQLEATQTIRQSAESLLAIINDILDLSKIEAGRLDLELTRFRPAEVVDGVVKLLRPRVEHAGLQITAACELPEFEVIGDPIRIRQVLMNLVGNAIKFTERGSIHVKVEAPRAVSPEESEIDAGCWRFSVKDTGIGIPADKHASIFESFTQVDGSIARRFGGTGLGLSISSRLVRAMGGRIWVESEPERGAEFHFTTRLEPAMDATFDLAGHFAESDLLADGPLAPLDILLVDDNVVNQRVTETMLRNRGHRVVIAADGQEGLGKVLGARFDVVLMDVQMPVMNGWDATRAIRLREQETGDHLPIIAMTAHALPQDVERCRAAGMDGYVSKPFQVAALIQELSRVMALARRAYSLTS